eukprot:EC713861.1.p2 GENE.EC713861.1~~EC713861.1.p2  ORF type:complete len:69 (+),score=1.65 EC713861.1:93-299(+)
MPNKEDNRMREARAQKMKTFLSSMSSAMRQDRIDMLARVSQIQDGIEGRAPYLDAFVDGDCQRFNDEK